jgi:hypothetical protein
MRPSGDGSVTAFGGIGTQQYVLPFPIFTGRAGVDASAIHTAGTQSSEYPRPPWANFFGSENAAMRLALFAANAGWARMGVLKALLGRYQRPFTCLTSGGRFVFEASCATESGEATETSRATNPKAIANRCAGRRTNSTLNGGV